MTAGFEEVYIFCFHFNYSKQEEGSAKTLTAIVAACRDWFKDLQIQSWGGDPVLIHFQISMLPRPPHETPVSVIAESVTGNTPKVT